MIEKIVIFNEIKIKIIMILKKLRYNKNWFNLQMLLIFQSYTSSSIVGAKV